MNLIDFQSMLFQRLQKYAQKVAIENEREFITYAELYSRSLNIIRNLQHGGIEPHSVVGIYLQNRTHIIHAIIGVLGARCVFTNIDPKWPGKLVSSVIGGGEIKLLICSRADSDILDFEKLGISILFIEDILTHREGLSNLALPTYDLADSIYIYFTSGSTSNRKGVVGKNSALTQFILWEIKEFDINDRFRFSQLISPYFDAFLRDIFVPLFSGGIISIPADPESIFDQTKMTNWIESAEINCVHCVPSIFKIINNPGLSLSNYASLKYVFLSGEQIIPSDLDNWFTLFGENIQLVNFYGATETTMIRLFYRIKQGDNKLKRIPIGKPIDDTELLILNDDLEPCGILEPGELYISSKYVTYGYLNAPDLTSERFVRLSDDEDIISFKTGDICRSLPSGQIELIGRKDREFKILGARISPSEIETVINSLSYIKQSLVFCSQSASGNDIVVASIVLSEQINQEVAKQAVTIHLQECLPAYQVPSRILIIDEFPLLSNGKIDFLTIKTLADIELETVIGPGNEIEFELHQIWSEILKKDNLSITETFYHYGGNSLDVMRLLTIIYARFNVKISLGDLFKNLTIESQASLISTLSVNDAYVIPKLPKSDHYRLSSSEERLYFAYEINKERTSYNLPVLWKINAEYHKERIEYALNKLICRHEALRATFKIMDGGIFKLISDPVEFRLLESDVDEANMSASINSLVTPFDLQNGPLFRAVLLNDSNGSKYLFFDIHHIVCDGQSQHILFEEFVQLIKGDVLTDILIQYTDFAAWEYNFRKTEEYGIHREFWLRIFEKRISELKFPIIHQDYLDTSDSGSNVIFSISSRELKPLFDHFTGLDITKSSVLLMFYFLMLERLTGQSDIVVGVASTNRSHQEVTGLIGMFTKMLPIRFDVYDEFSFEELTKKMHSLVIEAYSNQIYDLSDILLDINGQITAKNKNLIQAVFVFHNYSEVSENAGVNFSFVDFNNRNSKYPITVYVTENNDRVDFRLEYSSAYFSQEIMQLIVAEFQLVIKSVISDIKSPLLNVLKRDAYPLDIQGDDIYFNL